jgi:peptide/nickel transport system substrate-binding protein
LTRAQALRRSWLATALCIAVWLTFVPAAGAANGTAQPVFKGAYTSFPDYMDPQLAYTAEGWTAMYATYIPLLTYRHAEGKAGSEVIPGLARELPQITDGGKTYTLFLRPGLKYSSGSRVRASDFKFTVERLFRVNSGGSPFYTGIVGAKSFARKQHAHISGITTNDQSGKIVIHLIHPQGTFSSELALLFVAPVPTSTPLRDQTFDPPPATGPYAITSSRPGRGWSYARNPAWRKNGPLMPEIPGGHVGRIEISVIRSQETQVDELISGRLDWLFDPPPSDRLAEIEAGKGGAQLRVGQTLSTYYFWLNTRKAPFSSLKVRRAVEYAVDPAALARIYSGQLTPTDQILPPDMPGYEQFDLYPHDLKAARRLVREAHPSDRRITVWSDSESPNDDAGVYLRGVLDELGFDARLRIVNPDNYFTVIGNRQTSDLDAGFADWFEDYAHPNDFFQPLLASKPTKVWNQNFANLTAPQLAQEVATLGRRPLDEPAYAALDRSYMKLAPIVPYGTRTLAASFSRAVDLEGFVWNPTFEADLTSFKLR